jgi:LmbE family N-acetylglucosaminyl deacetylase
LGQLKTTRNGAHSSKSPRARRTTFLRSLSLNRLRTIPRWQRFLLLFLTSPFLLGAGASGAYYLRMHQVCEEMSLDGLPLMPDPAPGRRILVLAPHCDDETLGAGGLIADARRAGVPVRVAFLTNGDGFPVAASRALREVHIAPSDYVRFAEKRQSEALRALSVLGVPSEEVRFLGYPDRGLKTMWETNWDAAHPYRSPYTRQNHSPYHRTFTPNTSYCGASVVSDLERLMREYEPTEILVTHPADDHPDHSIAAWA